MLIAGQNRVERERFHDFEIALLHGDDVVATVEFVIDGWLESHE